MPPEISGVSRPLTIAPRISRGEALQVPAVLRARNLICGSLGSLPIGVRAPDGRPIPVPGSAGSAGRTVTYLPPVPDPEIPTSVLMSQTYEDLLFEGVAWWRVMKFGWHGYPVEARHIPVGSVHVAPAGSLMPSQAQIGPDQPFPVDGMVYVDGVEVPDNEIIRFDSPNPPLLVHAARAIRTCLRLDDTAARYADEPTGIGYFEAAEPGVDPFEDEPDSDASLEAFLNDWSAARKRHAWGWIPPGIRLGEGVGFSPRDLQLADARQHAVLEIARATGLEAEDLGVSVTSRVYENRVARNQDRISFTLGAYPTAVEQRLSMRDILPLGYETWIDFGGFLRADAKTRMETYKIGREVGAWADDDEVRAEEGKPALTAAQKAARKPAPAPAPAEPDEPVRQEVPA